MERIDGVNLFFTHNSVAPYGKTPQWALQGVVKSNVCSLRVHRIIENECDVDCWWRLDTLGISTDEQFTESEKTAMIQVQQSVVKTRLGYQVRLPFKGTQLPSNNYCNAAMQLGALEKQFQKDPGYRESYQRVLDTYLSSGFTEEVSDPQNNGYFTPHFGVREESSTTPLRIVFNASPKRKGELSLNNCLYAGPNLVELLCDVLRFRTNSYAVISDIVKSPLNGFSVMNIPFSAVPSRVT
ncbi:uncharacterized protein [Macrobrachium rosenbergii]|uniref:uncharacterized protein n=1 Tax=Macrobrachium rosenbergii TaxID=79674 RepID=UPI0034D42B02